MLNSHLQLVATVLVKTQNISITVETRMGLLGGMPKNSLRASGGRKQASQCKRILIPGA